MPKYPGISPYDNEKGTLGTAKKRWEKIFVKEIESDTVSGINATIENLATTATNSVSAAVSAKNDAVSAKNAAEAAQTAAETAAAGIQSVVETDVDNTLSIAGVAADAKATGDWLRDIAKPVTLNTSLPETAYAEEYMKVTTDSEGRVLYGVKRDGSFTWQKGTPRHVIEACNPTMDNPEWLYLIKDQEDKVVFGIKRDGSVSWPKGTPQHVIEACNPTMESDEYLYLIKDPDDRVIFAIRRDGSVTWQKGIPHWLENCIGQEIDGEDYIYAITDQSGIVLLGIKPDGTVLWQKGIPSHLEAYIKEQVQSGDTRPISPITGKTWAILGDSLTYSAGDPKKYWVYVAEDLGLNTLDRGIRGAGYKTRSRTRNINYLDMIQTLNPNQFDFMTIMGSGNDQYGNTLGEITDTTTDTVLGCVNLSIEAYMDIAYGKPLGLVTPSANHANEPPFAENTWYQQYSDAIIKIARKQGLPCMDLYHSSGLRPWQADFHTNFFLDGGHPNDEAHKLFLAPKFRAFVLGLI